MGCFWNLRLHCLNNCRYHLFRSRRLQLIPIWQNSERLLQGSELHRPPSSRSWYYSTWFRAAELHNNCICVRCHEWAWLHCPSSPQCKYQLLCVGTLLRSDYSQSIPLLTVLFATTCHSTVFLHRRSTITHMRFANTYLSTTKPTEDHSNQWKHWGAPSLNSDSVYKIVAPTQMP